LARHPPLTGWVGPVEHETPARSLWGLRYRLGDGDRPDTRGVRVRLAATAGRRIGRAVSSIGTKPSSRTCAPGCDQPSSGRTRTALRRSNADRRQRTSGPPKARNDRPVALIMSARAANRIIADRTGSRSAQRPVPRDVPWYRRPVAPAPSPCLSYPATAEAVGAARREVVRLAREAGASPGALADLELAASEASTNAILHAYDSTGTRGEAFTIAIASNGSLFSVWVIDEGQGGTPKASSPGLGPGLALMARLCERVLIGVLKDGRTHVEMRFDLRVAAPS
jgi:anti-sigma regulatory factor (Ser/Thr protein kinase)